MGEVRTAFEPAVHGFHFPNSFSTTLLPTMSLGPFHTPQIALGGLCGGMTFAALDYFFAGRPIPTHTTDDYPPPGVPPATSALRAEIFRRHLSSVGFEPSSKGIPVPGQSVRVIPGDLRNLLRYPRLRSASTTSLAKTLDAEVNAATSALAAGRPIAIGLVSAGSLFQSHQVAAVGFDDSQPASVRIYVYDCRNPDLTGVLTVTPANVTCVLEIPGQSPEPWRAFFVSRYTSSPPAYTDLALANSFTPAPLPDSGASVRFTVRNRGDAVAHATTIGVRVGADTTGPAESVGVLAPGAETAYDHEIAAGAEPVVPVYTDGAGHTFVLPGSG